MVEKIQFDCIHRLQRNRENHGKPRLLMEKFERFKDKALVKSFSKHLAGKQYGQPIPFRNCGTKEKVDP